MRLVPMSNPMAVFFSDFIVSPFSSGCARRRQTAGIFLSEELAVILRSFSCCRGFPDELFFGNHQARPRFSAQGLDQVLTVTKTEQDDGRIGLVVRISQAEIAKGEAGGPIGVIAELHVVRIDRNLGVCDAVLAGYAV